MLISQLQVGCLPGKSFVRAALLLCLLLPSVIVAQQKSNSLKQEKIMVNVAADAIAIYPPWRKDIDSLGRAEIIATLRKYIDEYAGAQVTTLFFNVNYQRAAYDSKIMTPYWDLPSGVKPHEWPASHAKLHNKKVDPFAVCIKRSRERNMSPWLSIRMNDHHYWNDSTRLSNFVLNNRNLWLYPYAFLDYSKKEVRDYYMAFINEALDKYDVDGIELDWIRTNTLFKEGTPQEWIAVINDFMKQVRDLVNRKAARRKHAIEIATRVLATPEISESYGLDGIAWVKNGWTDVLIPANWHNPINFDIPLEVWRSRIGAGYHYILAPSADMFFAEQRDPYSKIMRADLQTMRAFAVGAYSRGADAIYLFNHFNQKDYNRKEVRPDGTSYTVNDRNAILSEIGSPETLQPVPRRHPLTYPDPAGRNKKLATPIPADITTQETSFQVYTGPKPANGKYSVILGLENGSGIENADLLVKVNGVPATPMPDLPRDKNFVYTKTKKWQVVENVSEVAARVLCFKATDNAIQPGNNIITITNRKNEKQQLIWLEVKID